ncbi:MAG: Rpn family recombination-promoting nuclease/putative transposase [Coriobacteriales bacterium]|jgi:predicted transposase/invertase (TIGR01784 family)|nr:Rpn family recombination-promoting nuclease/putative transposase [Coriobacteriales bacterium]
MITGDIIIPKILPAYDDAVFKTLLTHPDAGPVLRDVVSSVIMSPVEDVVVRNTEMPIDDTSEKRERLDINCRTVAGELVAIEMQAEPMEGDSALHGHTNIKSRSVYNLCDLHSTQPGRGVGYADLMRSYQVVFCNYTVFPSRPDFVSRYSLRDEDGEELSDSIGVVFIELSKLGQVVKKGVGNMTSLEAWSVFFANAHKPEYKSLITELSDVKEEVHMANSLLMSISQDEIQQAHYRSRRIFERDMEHGFAVARKEGRTEVAANLLEHGMSIQEVIDITGLTLEDIERLTSV